MRLGNGKWETAKFNDRLQLTELGLGSSATNAGAWKVNYAYAELGPTGEVLPATNTGNIGKITLSFAGLANPLVQRFKYDSLYRLTEATERAGTETSSPQNWIQTFGYDRYGNRTSAAQNIGGLVNNQTPAVDPLTNRFTSPEFLYDKNGNVIRDTNPTNNQSRSFVFNGDNKQTEVKDANGNPVGKYFYDGEGKRVKKETNLETTVFVYSAGKLVAEYSTKLSQNPTTSYTTTDHLGSPRVITDALGQVKSRRDFLPFGEELTINVGERSQSLKYETTADDVRQKFTGYQKDGETRLDFAEARMYENRHARFTAIDPLLTSARSVNPQSWNRYIYVVNNPLILIDPSGEVPGDYYDKEGNWLFTDYIDDKRVYLAIETTTAAGAINYEVHDLLITHDEFKIISNIVKKEGATDDTKEYLWIAHASNNRAGALNTSLYRLLMSSFSSVANKTGLSKTDGSLRANAARAGVIDVLSGGADPTDGAQFWDGTDFLAWGLKSPNGTPQNKFEENDSIVIREDVFNTYVSSQGKNSVRYGRRQYAIPADVFNRSKNPNNWGTWNRDGNPESGFVYRINNGSGILYATGAAGKSIFWNPNYQWEK